jgi:hypothetical protein
VAAQKKREAKARADVLGSEAQQARRNAGALHEEARRLGEEGRTRRASSRHEGAIEESARQIGSLPGRAARELRDST